jgi:hypothetical protein
MDAMVAVMVAMAVVIALIREDRNRGVVGGEGRTQVLQLVGNQKKSRGRHGKKSNTRPMRCAHYVMCKKKGGASLL